MSTKMGIWRGALAGAAILLAVSTANARVVDPVGVTTTDPAALVLYPKLHVDPNTCQGRATGGRYCTLTPEVACTGNEDCQPTCSNNACNLDGAACTSDFDCLGAGIDTVVQLTNVSEFQTRLLCFYTNANGHCSNDFTRICTEADFRDVCAPGGLCIPGWQETDFELVLTKRQPISWSVNSGLPFLPLATGGGQNGQFNDGTIPPVTEIPFKGELFCIETDLTTGLPIDRNDLKGEASIIRSTFADIDDAKYNAYGIKAIEGRQDENPKVLNIGGPDAEYGVFSEQAGAFVGCPNILTLNHFFEGAEVATHGGSIVGPVNSDLTIVPCARDYLLQVAQGAPIVVQFLIYNEFEQRFSTSTSVNCFEHTRLVDIDTRPGPDGDDFSIFSAGVQGTWTGMSRLRSVQGPNVDGYDANGILALLSEHWASGRCEFAPPGAQEVNSKVLLTQLCNTDADCNGLMNGPESARCVSEGSPAGGPFFKSATTNVPWIGFREQGDEVFIP
ncbi:MAG: hypothetical protein AB7V27_04425 [Candidatus Binatia bacterium]